MLQIDLMFTAGVSGQFTATSSNTSDVRVVSPVTERACVLVWLLDLCLDYKWEFLLHLGSTCSSVPDFSQPFNKFSSTTFKYNCTMKFSFRRFLLLRIIVCVIFLSFHALLFRQVVILIFLHQLQYCQHIKKYFRFYVNVSGTDVL